MRIRTTETFEQKYKNTSSQNNSQIGRVDYLKFNKNEIYQFFIVPKVVSIDLEKDEVELDYPFEELTTHFGLYEFMRDYAKMRPSRFNCRGACAIENWMSENRLPKSVFKTAVGTKFFLAYVIHEKKIKVAWFQDYLYAIYLEQIAKLMNDKEIELIDALRHRVKLYTNSSGKFDIEVDHVVLIPLESQGFKNILQSVNEKSLNSLIDQQITTDYETVESVLYVLKEYTESVVKNESERARREKMEKKTEDLATIISAFKEPEKEKETNGIATDEFVSVGPNSILDDGVSVEDPF